MSPLGWFYAAVFDQLAHAAGAGTLDAPVCALAAPALLGGIGLLLAGPALLVRLRDDRRRRALEIWSYRLAVRRLRPPDRR